MSVKIDCFIHIPDGIRTRNLKIRSLTPYPLGHGDIFACAVEIIQRLGLINACACNIFFLHAMTLEIKFQNAVHAQNNFFAACDLHVNACSSLYKIIY